MGATSVGDVITVEDVRRITASLPRSYEVVVRDQIKFRVGRIVFVAFSRDETVMGVGFPKEERAAMVAAEPDKFMLPRKSDMRYNWIHVRLDAIDLEEVRELVIDAWRMCVPKKVAASSADRIFALGVAVPAPQPDRRCPTISGGLPAIRNARPSWAGTTRRASVT